MGPGDTFLLKILADSPSFEAISLASVETWWRDERNPQEGLSDFLVRQGIFVSKACKALEAMHKNRVTSFDGEQIFTMQGQGRLRERFGVTAELAIEPSPDVDDPLQATELRPSEANLETEDDLPQPESPEEPAADPALQNLKIGCVLGDCLLTQRLGQGTSGVVFQALHTRLNITVAVKVLPRSALDHDGRVYQQFKTEALILGQLNHPHIIRLLDFHDDPILPYLVLEFVEGLTLAELIHQSGKLRLDRAARIIDQVAQGLAAARKLGIVHRDVKPGNILLARDGKAKLADLGLAVVNGEWQHKSAEGAPRTEMAGTAAYLSPEQALNASVIDHRSDIYALGATFYHALTGQFPFQGCSSREVMLKHIQEQPVPPHHLVPDLDSAASGVILKMMAKDPAARYAEYEDLLDELAVLHPGSPPSPAAPVVTNGRSNACVTTTRAQTATHRQASGFYQGHLGKVSSVAFAPHGQTLVTGSVDQTARLWDVVSGKERRTLQGHAAEISAVAFAADGKVVATASLDKTTRLWDPTTGQPLATLKGYASEITSVAFSPDNRLVGTGCADGSVKLWDRVRKRELITLKAHTSVVTSLAFSPDSKTLATASGDETAKLWDTGTGKELMVLRGHKFGVGSVAYAPGGKTLATGSWDTSVKIWEVPSGRERATLSGHAASVRSVAFSPDGKLLASASWDKTVRVWALGAPTKQIAALNHPHEINSVAFAPGGKLLATGSDDGMVSLLEVPREGSMFVRLHTRGAPQA